ncbi:MAG TPA: undecaprenyl-diphosphate phosphatase [Nannocystaceae bacterium]|nr:undecaprenyl-diphosphate phosphatase [Nannocystaceae bacterium]
MALALLVAGLVAAPALAFEGTTGGLSLGAAALLGVVQGITEFLPISSDGHLALGQRLLGIDPASGGHRFTITVHAGTLLAVVITYRRDLVDLARAALHPAEQTDTRHLLLAMLVASVPLGLVLLPGVEAFVIATESSIRFVGVALWATALALWLGFRHDRVHGPREPGRLPTLRQASIIGLAQVTAILPGVSRSGTTIATALGLGLDRAVAARFSFLISVIAVSGAVAKEGLAVAMAPVSDAAIDPAPYLVGFVTSFVVGIAALRALLVLVGRGQVRGFIVYLAIVGGVAVALG